MVVAVQCGECEPVIYSLPVCGQVGVPIVSLQFCGLELEPEGVVKGGGGQGGEGGIYPPVCASLKCWIIIFVYIWLTHSNTELCCISPQQQQCITFSFVVDTESIKE